MEFILPMPGIGICPIGGIGAPGIAGAINGIGIGAPGIAPGKGIDNEL